MLQLLYLQQILFPMNINKIVFAGILIVFCMKGQSQTADFTADITEGCGSLTVQFTDQSTGASSWQWDFNNDGTVDSDQQNPVYAYNSPGIYDVSLTINNSTIEEKTAFITVYPNPDSSFLYKDTLAIGSFNYVFRNVRQSLENRINYTRNWTFSDGFTTTGRTIVRTFPDTGVYRVRMVVSIDGFDGCSSELTRRVTVRNELVVPNVFTPNDDGVNDLFIVSYNGLTYLDFRVYGRYGNVVYKSYSPVIVWDGVTLSGQELNPGVYYYTLSSEDGEISEAGYIHLFR